MTQPDHQPQPRNRPEPDPHSRFEDEGIPDLQEGTPEQQRAVDPSEMPLPGDQPVAVDEWGTTAEEQAEGEPMDLKLSREQPDFGERPVDTSQAAGRIVEEDEGVRPDTEKDSVARDVGPDFGGYTAEEQAMRIDPS
ncbi:hypothetical protein SAMN04489712_116137 [Thermomonospora echinospora]|uniref:DUF5709 domain-containing protein n=1 Tax=Thermomonospora echinospora TaxID=1992 RepID=A0A1H6DFC4_9ACTN|nr:DUF5709 domain-containing protein [Thermomonospora echinospora]SEG84068.1 hypothetical protein SAMN04489712_116137 [Thermomonospora echinospora]